MRNKILILFFTLACFANADVYCRDNLKINKDEYKKKQRVSGVVCALSSIVALGGIVVSLASGAIYVIVSKKSNKIKREIVELKSKLEDSNDDSSFVSLNIQELEGEQKKLSLYKTISGLGAVGGAVVGAIGIGVGAVSGIYCLNKASVLKKVSSSNGNNGGNKDGGNGGGKDDSWDEVKETPFINGGNRYVFAHRLVFEKCDDNRQIIVKKKDNSGKKELFTFLSRYDFERSEFNRFKDEFIKRNGFKGINPVAGATVDQVVPLLTSNDKATRFSMTECVGEIKTVARKIGLELKLISNK